MWKEAVVAELKILPGIYLERLRKTRNIRGQDRPGVRRFTIWCVVLAPVYRSNFGKVYVPPISFLFSLCSSAVLVENMTRYYEIYSRLDSCQYVGTL
jgi:hypothetical protein